MSDRLIGVGIFGAVAAAGIGITVLSSAYVVNEGNVAVKTYMGQATGQEGPAGLQFKTPFLEGVKEFDVRERSLQMELTGATSNQLTSTVRISVNWRPDATQILKIFKEYGTPDEFAAQIIVPRLTQSAKSTIGQFSGVQLTTQRNQVAEKIAENARLIFEGYPAFVSSVQFEDFTLPERYWEQVIIREERREVVEQTRLDLQKQQLEAQRDVQTAEAARDAAIAQADGEAYRIKTEALAAAEATRLQGEANAEAALALLQAQAQGQRELADALTSNPKLVEYKWAENWKGAVPQMSMGGGSPAPIPLLDLNAIMAAKKVQ